MRKWLKIGIPIFLLAAGAILCAVRWQAWFVMPDEPQWTGDTLTYVFPTFGRDSLKGFVRTQEGWRDTVSPESLDILVMGDIHNRLQRSDYDSLAVRVPQADAVAQVGDWMDRGQFYYYQLLVREWTNSALCGLPVINCPGNHEYAKGLHKDLAPDWRKWFSHPEKGVSMPGVFYYVDFPELRFIVMDTNPLDPLVYRTRALTWLREVMNSAGGRYLVVMAHHPVFSAAKGRVNPLIYSTFRYALGQCDLVICGHDHSYMRSVVPTHGNSDGTVFVVLNTAGRAKPQKKQLKADRLYEEPVYSVISIARHPDIQADSIAPLYFRTYRLSDGEEVDSFYVSHH